MDINIGEMSLGDIIARGVQLFFKRLPYFFAIELIVLSPTLILQLALPDLAINQIGLLLLVLLPMVVLGPIGSAAMLRLIVQEYLDGTVNLGEAFQFALGRFLPLLGTGILGGILITLGYFACCIPGIYLAVIWSMMSQVVVVENLSGMDALNRSKALTENYFWRVFGLILLLGLCLGLAGGVINIVLAVALPHVEIDPGMPNPLMPARVSNYANYAVVHLVSTLVQILVQTLSAVCVTLLYFDLRHRKEGYDPQMEFAKIVAWRERSWDDDDEFGVPSAGSGAPPAPTGIKEPGTALPPLPPPETGIKDADAGPPPS